MRGFMGICGNPSTFSAARRLRARIFMPRKSYCNTLALLTSSLR
jgi:hypothetical protein